MSKAKKEKKKAGALKVIWNTVTWILVLVIVLGAIALAGVRLVGLQPFAVLSGSMEPTYHTGSIVYVKKIDYHELKAGDPITFMLDEKTLATHRIVEVIPDAEEPDTIRFRTKGDANENEDAGLVHCKNVVGKPVFTIPKLGYVSNYIQNPPGNYIMMSCCAILVMFTFLPDVFASGDDEPQKKKKKAETADAKDESETAAPADEASQK